MTETYLSLWRGDIPKLHTMRSITEDVASKHGCSIEELRGPSRVRVLVAPRQEAMWRIRQELSKSWGEIGRYFGERDHTTALYGVRAHIAKMTGHGHPKPRGRFTRALA